MDRHESDEKNPEKYKCSFHTVMVKYPLRGGSMKKEGMITIGELSAMTGLTVKALRFYEREGLVLPDWVDPLTRYRYYSRQSLIPCELIRTGRALGLGIPEIRTLLTRRDREGLAAKLARHRASLIAKKRELDRAIRSVAALSSELIRGEELKRPGRVSEVTLETRYALTRPIDVSGAADACAKHDARAGDADRAYFALAQDVEKLGLCALHGSGAVFENDGTGTFRPTHVFLTVHQKEAEALLAGDLLSGDRKLMAFQGGRYACVRLPVRDPTPGAKALNAWLGKRGIVPRFVLQVNVLTDPFGETEFVDLEAMIGPDAAGRDGHLSVWPARRRPSRFS